MEYLTVEQAKKRQGLRLILTRGIPNPWCEAAKAVFSLRNVDYVAVEQKPAQDNLDLVEWTRHRNAPVALFDTEAPRVRYMEIVDLAERLGTGPSLVPQDRDARIFMIGLINEIAGECGMLWNARLLMLDAGIKARGPKIAEKDPMYADYGYDSEKVKKVKHWLDGFLSYLAKHLSQQKKNGSPYLIGSEFTAADVYWAYFSNVLETLPPEQNPMPNGVRKAWATLATSVSAYDPILIEHRDKMFKNHLILPLSF
ncbi:MAG: glutathione S-transferase family protein [Pseudomonadales bacterium]|nr:glutathione S-transferase family protein [Pseudomonadales bacterium]